MKRLIALTALALCAGLSQADDLTPKEIHTELLFAGTLLLDYSQTRDIKNHPGMYETNPILGKHPSDDKIATYFVLAGVGHYLVTKALPAEYRPAWQWGAIGLETLVILHNKQIGLSFKF